MNKQQAYEAMRDGFRIRNEYYTDEEWLEIKDGVIKTEEGYTMSMEDWNKYQDPDMTYEWEVIGDGDKFIHANQDYSPTDLPTYLYRPTPTYDPSILYSGATKKQRSQIVRPVEPRSDINRNDPCMCGSGMKFKKCCGI